MSKTTARPRRMDVDAQKELLPVHTSDLLPDELRLVAKMTELRFGRIESMDVRNGRVDWQSPFVIVRHLKFGSEGAKAPPCLPTDFKLKHEVAGLVTALRGIREGRIVRLVICNGLPASLDVVEACSGEGGLLA